MFPYVEFLGQRVYAYPIFGILAVFVASIVVYSRFKRCGLLYFDVLLGIVVLGVGLLIGGIAMFAITRMPVLWEHRERFADAPILFLQAAFGGMVFYGGLFGVVAALLVYSRVIKRPVPDIVRLVVPVFPLAHGIMRVGCFMAGCCYGVAHDWGIAFARSPVAPNGVPLLPVQLYEAMANMMIFAIVWVYTRAERQPLVIIGIYGICYSVVRFFLEYLRGDYARGFVWGVATSQLISVVVFVASIGALICGARMNNSILNIAKTKDDSTNHNNQY